MVNLIIFLGQIDYKIKWNPRYLDSHLDLDLIMGRVGGFILYYLLKTIIFTIHVLEITTALFLKYLNC